MIRRYNSLRYKTAVLGFFVLFVPSLLCASQRGEKTVAVVVSQRDTLVHICAVWLEDPLSWPVVARFNQLENPDLIYPGQQIDIPVKLLKGIPMPGEVTFVKGDVQAYPPGGKKPGILKTGDIVDQGTEIETGDGAVEITFEDGSSFFVRPETRIRIQTARQRQPYYMVRRLFVPIGKILTRIKKSTGQDSRFEIHSPSAVSAARGTRFRVSVDKDTVTRTEVLEGVVGVKGLGQEVAVAPGQGAWVKAGRSASAPESLLNPPVLEGLKTLYQQLPVSFGIKLPEKAVACRVAVAKDPEMKDVVKAAVVKAGELVPQILLPDGGYYCQVTAVSRSGLEGLPSAAAAFKVRVNPLPPFIQKPQDGSEFKTGSIELEWLKVPDAAFYQLEVARQPDFSVPYKTFQEISDVRYSLKLEDYGFYYFRVRSIAPDGFEGLWSDTSVLRYLEPPKAPESDPPEVGENSITLRWQEMGPDMTYDFQMAADPDFNEILFEKNTESAGITFDRPEARGIYYVRIRAVDPDGYEGMFTQAQTFEIKKFPYVEAGVIMTWIAGALMIIF